MRLVIDFDGTHHEVSLAQHADVATLADLVESVCGARLADDDVVWVDEHQHTGEDRISGVTLLEGSRIARTRLERPTPVKGWSAIVTGGLDAGRTVRVPSSRPLLMGRSPQADVTIDSASASWSHVTVEQEGEGLRVKDAGSTNGTFVNGEKVDENGALVEQEAVVTVGGTTITLRRKTREPLAPQPGSLHNVTPAGTVPFNRPPRPGRPPEPEEVEPPRRKSDPAPTRFSMATILAPLVMAFAMVMIMGSPRYALFALLSPVIGIGTWIEGKRRRKAEIADEDERFEQALVTFESDIEQAMEAERLRRRDDVPDPATAMRRASLPTTRVWQRRPRHGEFLRLHAGIGDVPWKPSVEKKGGRFDDEVREILDATHIPAGPVEADLTDAGVVGIIGDREGALAVARSLLCQAAVHCGPADMTIGVFCDQGRDQEWSWTTWLPHVRLIGGASGGQWLSDDRQRSEQMLRSMRDGIEHHPTPTVLLVLDSDVLTEGRDAPARRLLGHGRPLGTSSNQKVETRVSGIVIAPNEESLPAACTTVIRVAEDAHGTVTRPDDLTTVDDVIVAGIDVDSARRCALDLARFEDPELVVPGAALPGMVRLPPLLGLEDLSAASILESWSSSKRIDTPVGVGESGPFGIDLVRDGPHGLVGGTTGSGKSEFLRSMVAGLAARTDPTKLTFILIDFKGGAAFASCERLPHTIGTISNLDEQLADRALRALEAEMRYRQEVFAAAGEGIDNLDAYWATKPEKPMPRLLLVVDEFAMLAKEFPDVLSSLVSVAAVGRTLGVHMILATQRPAGVVNDDILANTNMRVALRVQSREDSSNVIGVPDASAIGRTQMGRAYVKLGQDDISPVQTALVTGRSESSSATLIEAHPLGFGVVEVPRGPSRKVDEDAPTDLDLLIEGIVEANEQAGHAPPRPVWPEPLGEQIDLTPVLSEDEVAASDRSVGAVDRGVVQFALADEPDRQRQVPVGWDVERGNIMLGGIPGSGTSTGLASIALTLASHYTPDDLDLIVLDLGSRDLAPLADLPHCAAYVGSGSTAREQQVRLLKHLRAELDRRKQGQGTARRTVVLIDGLAVLKEEYDDFEGIKLLEGLYRAYADGPDVGLHFAITTSRIKSVPGAMDEVTTQKWLFRLADPYDYTTAGIKKEQAPPAVAGRCVLAEGKLQAHVASPAGSLTDAVARIRGQWPGSAPKPPVVRQLPDRVTVADLGAVAEVGAEPIRIPVGIRESDLEPAWLETFEGEHIVVAGGARSGKSTALLTIIESIRRGAVESGTEVAIWGICGRRSPLPNAGLDKIVVGEDELAALLATARVHRGPLVLVVDDAEKFEDSDQSIAGLVRARTSDLLVVAAGRADELRSSYGHWTKQLRKAGCGLLLQPNVDYDGDLLGARLPRKAPVAMTVGRGYIVTGGTVDLLQTALPTGSAEA